MDRTAPASFAAAPANLPQAIATEPIGLNDARLTSVAVRLKIQIPLSPTILVDKESTR